MIIETSDNRLFRVCDSQIGDHVWEGVEVKRGRGGFERKARAQMILVRKAGSRVVDATPEASYYMLNEGVRA